MTVTLREVTKEDLPIFFEHQLDAEATRMAAFPSRDRFTRMWQSTISLRYVSYKNADSNLHERICAMAMTAKNLLWSCAQIVPPRPPINPQRPNQTMERTADRCALHF